MGLIISGGSASTPSLPSFTTGDYITSPYSVAGGAATANGRADFAPILVPKACSIDALAVRITTVAASSTIRLGIYTNVNGRPGLLVVDAGTLDASSTPGAAPRTGSLTVAKTLAAGIYWTVAQSEGGTPSVNCVANKTPLTVTDPTNVNGRNGFGYTHTGPLAADLTAQAWTDLSQPPIVYLHIA